MIYYRDLTKNELKHLEDMYNRIEDIFSSRESSEVDKEEIRPLPSRCRWTNQWKRHLLRTAAHALDAVVMGDPEMIDLVQECARRAGETYKEELEAEREAVPSA